MRAVRVDSGFLGQQFLCDLVRRNPHMIVSGQVNLVNRPVLLPPVCKFDEAVLLGYIRYGADDGVT